MTGYYVTAREIKRTAWLCGPFETVLAAIRMVESVRRAAGDPYRNAAFGVTKRTGETLPPGRLDLTKLKLDDVIEASRQK